MRLSPNGERRALRVLLTELEAQTDDAELEALFADGDEIVEDHVPDLSFETRVNQERMRILRRLD